MDEDYKLSLSGFHIYRKQRPTESKAKHGGVMTAVSNAIRHKPLE